MAEGVIDPPFGRGRMEHPDRDFQGAQEEDKKENDPSDISEPEAEVLEGPSAVFSFQSLYSL
jgi:hypothetical protein